jgi:adenosylcobinamide-phosphate synthase
VMLGGAAVYEGVVEARPLLGMGRVAEQRDIRRAWRLVLVTTLAWLFALALIGFCLQR